MKMIDLMTMEEYEHIGFLRDKFFEFFKSNNEIKNKFLTTKYDDNGRMIRFHDILNDIMLSYYYDEDGSLVKTDISIANCVKLTMLYRYNDTHKCTEITADSNMGNPKHITIVDKRISNEIKNPPKYTDTIESKTDDVSRALIHTTSAHFESIGFYLDNSRSAYLRDSMSGVIIKCGYSVLGKLVLSTIEHSGVVLNKYDYYFD